MIWRVLHRLFGWDYVAVEFGGAHSICRDRRDGDGNPYVRLYGHHIRLVVGGYRDWYPLTCRTDDIATEARHD